MTGKQQSQCFDVRTTDMFLAYVNVGYPPVVRFFISLGCFQPLAKCWVCAVTILCRKKRPIPIWSYRMGLLTHIIHFSPSSLSIQTEPYLILSFEIACIALHGQSPVLGKERNYSFQLMIFWCRVRVPRFLEYVSTYSRCIVKSPHGYYAWIWFRTGAH